MPGAYLQAWDSDNKKWVKVLVDDTGRLEMSIVIARLDDIANVNAPSPSDNEALTWDAATSKWIPEAVTPGAHKTSHEDGGDDEISIAGLVGAILSLTFIIDGGGSAITTGEKGHLEIPFACTINRVTMMADQSGSIVVDIWKDTYANFPPTNADSITASAPPTISTAQKSQDSTLTGWTTAIAAGDILAFNVDSVTDIERVTISLKVTKT